MIWKRESKCFEIGLPKHPEGPTATGNVAQKVRVTVLGQRRPEGPEQARHPEFSDTLSVNFAPQVLVNLRVPRPSDPVLLWLGPAALCENSYIVKAWRKTSECGVVCWVTMRA